MINPADPLHVEIVTVLRSARFLPLRPKCESTALAHSLAAWLDRPTENRQGAAYLADLLRRHVRAASLAN